MITGLPAVAAASGIQIGTVHVPDGVLEAAAGIAVLVAAYCVLTSGRVRGHLRRLGICLGVAALLSAIGVGYVDHTRHPQVVAHSGRGAPMPPLETLAWGWGFGTLVLTVVPFVVATLVIRRRRGLGRNPVLRPRRRRRRTAAPPPLDLGGGMPWEPF